MASSLSLEEYSDRALATATYSRIPAIFGSDGHSVIALYPFLKLAGEAGEVCEKIGKCIRDSDGMMTWEQRDQLVKELGDVLWYVNACAHELGTHLYFVASENLDKLQSRAARNTIQGSGDNR